jgi:flavin reductase (DIM6/NTAB) family NADH-FMN oxidoreductase RutF
MGGIMESDNKLYHAYPKIATVVGVKCSEKTNYMTAAWHTYLSHTPPIYAVSISPKRYTHNLILKAKEFNCNFLPFDMINTIHKTGRISGTDYDKIKLLNLKTKPGKFINTPMLSEAYAVIECKLEKTVTTGDHTLFIGKIVHVEENEEAYKKSGLLNIEKILPTLYLGSDTYITIDKSSIKSLPKEVEL